MSDNGKSCPLKNWAEIEQYKLLLEGTSLEPVGALLMSLVREFILNPLVNAGIGAIVAGYDMYESIISAADSLINSISPTDWLAYAVSNNARAIYQVCDREVTLLNSVVSALDGLSVKRPKSERYRKISLAAVRNVKMLKYVLESASNADEFSVLLRYLNRAISIAESNYYLLSADAIRFMKAQSAVESTKSALSTREDVRSGKIKLSDAATNTLVAKSIEGASAIIRANAIDELDAATYKIANISRILYMYTGVDSSNEVNSMRSTVESLMSRVSSSVNSLGDIEYHAKDGDFAKSIDDAISEASKDIKSIISDIGKKITKKAGIYMMNTSPAFNPASDIYTIIGVDTDIMPKSEAVSAMLNISPYSNANNNTLTIYGSNLKLPTLINAFLECAEYLMGTHKDVSEDELESALSKMKKSAQRVADNADLRTDDDSVYSFDDSVGMSSALNHALYIKAKLATIKTVGGVNRMEQKLNNDNYIENIKAIIDGGIEKRIDEPKLGSLITITCIRLLVPGLIDRKATMEIIGIVKDRIKYLSDIKKKVSLVTNYRDEGCESIINDLKGSGLGFVADALDFGKVATGAMSLASGIAGIGKTMYDIISLCTDPIEPDIELHRETQSGVKRLDMAVMKSIGDAIDGAISPLGFSINTINSIQIAEEKQAAMLAKIT